jgi:hypothetical protein
VVTDTLTPDIKAQHAQAALREARMMLACLLLMPLLLLPLLSLLPLSANCKRKDGRSPVLVKMANSKT